MHQFYPSIYIPPKINIKIKMPAKDTLPLHFKKCVECYRGHNIAIFIKESSKKLVSFILDSKTKNVVEKTSTTFYVTTKYKVIKHLMYILFNDIKRF
jgi:hypothetical protein